jgi:hypothetical protein
MLFCAVTVESTGAYAPADIVRQAIAIFKQKIAVIKQECDRV